MPRLHRRSGFTLVEILIVVAILGILAALVVPRFSSATSDAQTSGIQQQLQTVRRQIELYRFRESAVPPDIEAGTGWDDLVGTGYLQAIPRNALRNLASGIIVGVAAPGAASGAAAHQGWYWNSTTDRLYAIGADGAILAY